MQLSLTKAINKVDKPQINKQVISRKKKVVAVFRFVPCDVTNGDHYAFLRTLLPTDLLLLGDVGIIADKSKRPPPFFFLYEANLFLNFFSQFVIGYDVF